MKQTFLLSKWAPVFFLAGLMFLASCKKDNNVNKTDNPDPVLSVDAAQNDANAATQFQDVFNIAMSVQSSDAGEDIGLGTGSNIIFRTDNTVLRDPSCFTVTVVPKILHEFPKTVTLDFGSGCMGKDGKLRSGKIVTIFTGPMLFPGGKASTTFINYNVDSFKIEGTQTVENKSTSNHFAWQVNIINGNITNTHSSEWLEWNCVRDHEQITGNGSPFYSSDNVFKTTGNSKGSKSDGNSWTAEITQPVISKFTCAWIVKGEITFTRNSNKKIAVLDFGDGSCDDHATVTVNDKLYTITLH